MREQDAPPRVALHGIASLDLFVRPGTPAEQREAVLLRGYREQRKALIPPLLEKWQSLLGMRVNAWGINEDEPSGEAVTPPTGRSGSIWNWPRSRCPIAFEHAINRGSGYMDGVCPHDTCD